MNTKWSIYFLVLTFLFSHPSFAQGFMAVAKVSNLSGVAYGNKEPLKAGSEISEGMEINLAKKAEYLDIKFQNGHLFRLVGAQVKVIKLNPKNTVIEILKGKLYSNIKPLSQNETFDFKTKSASFSANSSQFLIDEDKKQTYLFVSEGSVVVKVGKNSVKAMKDEDVLIAPGRDLKASLATKVMSAQTKEIINQLK